MIEQGFQNDLIRAADLYGWLAFHVYDSRLTAGPGFPDTVLVPKRPRADDPTIIFAELKTTTGKLSPVQRGWMDALMAASRIEYQVWRPHQWDAIQERLMTRSQRRRLRSST